MTTKKRSSHSIAAKSHSISGRNSINTAHNRADRVKDAKFTQSRHTDTTKYSDSDIESTIIADYQGQRYRNKYSKSQDSSSTYRQIIYDRDKTKHDIEIYTVCDGHGYNGHIISDYVASSPKYSLPKIITQYIEKYRRKLRDNSSNVFLTRKNAEKVCKRYVDKIFARINTDNYIHGIDPDLFIDSGTTVVMVIAIDGTFRYILTIGDALAIWRSNGKIYRTDTAEPADDIGRLSNYLSGSDISYVLSRNRVRYFDDSFEPEHVVSLAVSRAIGDFRFNITANLDSSDGYIIAPIPAFSDLEQTPPDNGYIVIASDSVEEASHMAAIHSVPTLQSIYSEKMPALFKERQFKYYQYVYNASISRSHIRLLQSLLYLSTDDTTIVLLREKNIKHYYPNIEAASTFSDIVIDLQKGKNFGYKDIVITRNSLGDIKTTWETVIGFVIVISFISGGIDPLTHYPFYSLQS